MTGGYWSLCTVYVQGSVLLLNDQSDQRTILACVTLLSVDSTGFFDCQVVDDGSDGG